MRWNAWVALVIAMLAGHVLWLFLLRGSRILSSDSTLVLGQLLLGMGALAIGSLIHSTPFDARKLPVDKSRRIILGGTIGLQLLALLLLWPALSSDVGRYRFDGFTWLTGNSPYAVRPHEVANRAGADALDQSISTRDTLTTYPPVAQTVFIAARAIEQSVFGPASIGQPPSDGRPRFWRSTLAQVGFFHRAIALRLIFAVFAVASTLLLFKILQSSNRTPWLAVLFAWNPLLVLETAGQGHVDIVGIFLLLAMLRMIQIHNFTLATLALCLACGVKPMAILLAPLLIRRIADRQSWRTAQHSVGILAITLATVYGPILMVQNGFAGWLSQLNAYARYFEFNSGLFTLGKVLVGEGWLESSFRSLLLLLVPAVALGTLLWVLRKRFPIEDACYWLMLCPLLVSPAATPWAILWPLCFVPVMRKIPGWTALALAATSSLAYAAWRQPVWEVPPRIVLAEYLPVLIAFAIEARDLWRHRQPIEPTAATASA